MVKLLTLLFLTVGAFQAFAAWDGKSAKKPASESIDGKDFFLIKSEANLAWFRDSVNKVRGVAKINAKLMASLDMGGKLFVPIAAGSGDTEFGGTFDGNGFTISNLYINSEELGNIPNEFCPEKKPKCNAQNVGFIGVLGGGGVVKNLNLDKVDISASTNKGVSGGDTNPVSVGPVVGFQKGGDVEECFASGNILTSGMGNSVGGIVGNSWSKGISNSLSTITILVSGDSSAVGGIVGSIRSGAGGGSVTIKSCAYDGKIILNSGNGTAGGVVGFYEKGKLTVSRSYFDSDIIGNGLGKQTEGLVVDGSITATMSVNTAKVVCDLNGGEYANKTCSQGGAWSVGDVHVVLNGISRNDNEDMAYAIVFDANGGVFPEGSKTIKYLTSGETITADEISLPVHGDTAFGGWALTPDATKPTKDFGTVVTSKTIYAYWKNMFEITFNANSGKFPDGELTKKISVSEGSVISVAGVDLPTTYTADGKTYYFTGWATSNTATSALESLGKASANKVFYAVWTETPTYSVIFDTGDESSATFVEGDSKAEVPQPPTADGYEFAGWFADEKYTKAFDFEKTAITENTVVYAKWNVVMYKITYNLGGGNNNSANPKEYTVESETIVLKKPKKEGYVFNGWYYDKSFTKPATQISKGSTGDKTFYAKWTDRTYTITYMAGSYALEIIPADKKIYDVPVNLRGASYTRMGYIQDGWSTTNNGRKTYDLNEAYIQNADLTLYPYWIEDPLSIGTSKESLAGRFGVSVQNRGIEISSLKAGTQVKIFDMQGCLVKSAYSQGATLRVDGINPGSYIVRADSQARLVNVR